MMNHIFRDLHVKHLQSGHALIVYMDDILIAHRHRSKPMSTQFTMCYGASKNTTLYLKPEKCVWETSSVDYLG